MAESKPWGRSFLEAVEAVEPRIKRWLGNTVPLATDCSGMEAPVWAMRALGIQFSHEWSSDTSADVRNFIEPGFCSNTKFFTP